MSAKIRISRMKRERERERRERFFNQKEISIIL